ncbi:tryptophan-rich sensory protein [Candidatus Kuenenbacteria bacterium]|nr:tryptophan-rich sensory protein [Candidatus Kuenenbacteria bacterium]
MNTIFLRLGALVGYIIMVGVNYLAVSLPLAGRDTGAISDSYPNLFAPAGYAFSIWGLIYTLLGIYVIYQLTRKDDVLVARVNQVFIINTLLNAAWLFAWHYDVIWLSVIIMLAMLATLIRLADILREGAKTAKERWLVRLPFSIYFGWITVATIANITILLVSLGWNGFGISESIWTAVVLVVGTIIGSWRMWRDRYIPYGLVLLWAYGAILSKHLSKDAFDGQYPLVIWTVGACLLVFVIVLVLIGVKGKGNKVMNEKAG